MTMTTPERRGSGFAAAQALMLFIIAFTSVVSKPRLLLLEINQQTNIPIEFRALLISLPDLFVIALLALSGVRWLLQPAYRRRLADTFTQAATRWGGIWWFALIGWMVIGLVWALEPALQRFSTLHALALLLLAVILADLLRERGERVLLWGLLLGAAVQAAVAILQVMNGGPLGWWGLGEIDRFEYETTAFYRAPGLSMHPNYLGGYLVVALFACVLIARQNWSRGRSIALPLAVALLSAAGMIA
ncbi:MAG: hypothetical protein K8I30_21000, partial [Anaerolineae bacterium]|nr:hypothetical protein [Anaerolineae bacterium]